MDLRGFTEIGKDIGRRVTESINSGNFSQLNRDIKRTFEQAFSEEQGDLYNDVLDGRLYKEDQDKGFDKVYTKYDEAPVNENMKIKKSWKTRVPAASNMPGKGKAIAMMAAGYSAAGIFGISSIGMAMMTLMAVAVDAGTVAVAGLFTGVVLPFIIAVAGLILGINGTKRYGVVKRFNIYKSLLKKESFCLIKDMAARVSKSEKFTVRDLIKMIETGYFPEGHIDDHKKYFIGNDVTYKQYTEARDSAMKAKEETVSEPQPADEAIQAAIAEGEAYIKTIREANDAIYDPVISEKLYRMEIIVTKIFGHVKENPDQLGQLRRFMNYYMPTTEKLVRAYRQMDGETVLGQNMSRAKEEIAETLDTINEAYEKLYDSMHIDIVMDVSSDISVLKTMFAQEGLSKDELGGKKDE